MKRTITLAILFAVPTLFIWAVYITGYRNTTEDLLLGLVPIASTIIAYALWYANVKL